VFKELIWVKENSLTEQFCKSVIDKFETDPYRKPGKVDQNNPRIDKDLKVTIDTGITSNISWREEDQVLYKALGEALYEYETHLQKISLQKMKRDGWKLHPAHSYQVKDTGYKVQKYEPNGYYHWHHDWCMHKGWSRTYTYIWYLNTVEEKNGGWTEFIDGTKIQPKVGSILFFPATWTYVHRGYTTKVPKYLVNGWIYARP
jgi:hypothetical protein